MQKLTRVEVFIRMKATREGCRRKAWEESLESSSYTCPPQRRGLLNSLRLVSVSELFARSAKLSQLTLLLGHLFKFQLLQTIWGCFPNSSSRGENCFYVSLFPLLTLRSLTPCGSQMDHSLRFFVVGGGVFLYFGFWVFFLKKCVFRESKEKML